jgi:hypothetical protein
LRALALSLNASGLITPAATILRPASSASSCASCSYIEVNLPPSSFQTFGIASICRMVDSGTRVQAHLFCLAAVISLARSKNSWKFFGAGSLMPFAASRSARYSGSEVRDMPRGTGTP